MSKITFVYGKGRIFTGQRFASEMVAQGLADRGWHISTITPLLLDRLGQTSRTQKVKHLLEILVNLILSWWRFYGALRRKETIHVGLGQTKYAMLRDGLPLFLRRRSRKPAAVVIGLNGSEFMRWTADSQETKWFLRIAHAAQKITVVGPNQQKHLHQLGIPHHKLLHVDNACPMPPLTWSQSQEKHQNQEPLRLLFLSNLIEAKGYPEFIESMVALSQNTDIKMEAVLCGKLVSMTRDSRFASPQAAEQWIETQLDRINQSGSLSIKWIKGAFGIEKQKLFAWAHIFILPSRYKTEAQPISILEAMASGCAVITSTVGEIPNTVNPETAVLLQDPNPNQIAQAVRQLSDTETRLQMVEASTNLFTTRFAYDKHIARWAEIFQTLEK